MNTNAAIAMAHRLRPIPSAGQWNQLLAQSRQLLHRAQGLGLAVALGIALLAGGLASGARPATAEFSGVDYTLTNQNEQDFSGQDLANTSFAGAAGRHADFSGANLHGAILTQAAFPEASFVGADLSGVLMDKVDFSGADFSGANLSDVIAAGSNFSGATVTDADFSGALLDRVDQRLLCRDAEGTHPVTGVDTRMSLGC